jgi:hypothetical protein
MGEFVFEDNAETASGMLPGVRKIRQHLGGLSASSGGIQARRGIPRLLLGWLKTPKTARKL